MNLITKKIIEFSSKFIPVSKPVHIYYHDVTLDSGMSFMRINYKKIEEQFMYLSKNNYQTLLFSEQENDKLISQETIVISFDDGFVSNYEFVFPLALKYKIKFNIFLTLDYIGTQNYLTWDMINEMYQSGYVEFGAHTKSHIDSRKINDANFASEIINVNDSIHKNSKIKVDDFCFPFGMYNENILQYLDNKKVYRRLYTSDMVNRGSMNYSKIVGRIGIRDEDTLKDFERKVKGHYSSIYYFKRLRSFGNYHGI
ncbi:polysaccharide deacetylase family protein [Thalassobacillus hwangdonensis]|uniref:Polysaccharide deacetylase family protein n=1 Tax=Thalassobacillus hwangdonensis TaxID=546108 RepID=A0ABW3L3X3_9BACI